MVNAKRVFAITCLLLSMQLTGAEEADSEPVNSVAELDARIQSILDETGAPGMIGTIVYGDEIVWRGAVGMANLDFEQPVTHNTLFRVGSISKTFVSLAILKLVERGELSLDDLISNLAPETGVVNPWENTDPVRLVHTLEHTAGFDDIHFRDFAFSDANVTTLQGIEFNNGSRNVRWRPGTRMAYSNIGPAIAAVALENVTGMTFENFVKEEVFDPLGMNTASFFFAEGVASSYSPNNDMIPYTHILARPSGALNATSTDMAQLLRMFLGRGNLEGYQLIQPETLTRMELPETTVGAEQGLEIGYGLSNATGDLNGFIFHGHNGGIDGFSSYYGYSPEANRGFFYSVNQPNRPAIQQIRTLLSEFITQDLVKPAPPPIVELSEEELTKYEGLYETDSPRIQLVAGIERLMPMKVRAEEGNLVLQPLTGEATDLFPLGNDLFRRAEDPVATFAFGTSPDNENLLQFNQGTLKKIGPLRAYGRLLALLYGIIMFVSSLLFAIYWTVMKLRPKHKRPATPYLWVRGMPALAAMSLTLFGLSVMGLLGSGSPAEISLVSVGVFFTSLLFPMLAIVALYTVASKFQQRWEVGTAVWHFSMHSSLGMAVLALFLFSYGWIGLQTWAY